MPTISSAGVGSGLDVTGLVEKLVAAEGEPVRIRLDRKEAELQAGLSAMGTFKGVVSEFQSSLEALRNPDTFESIDISSSDEDALEAVASKDAQPGEYDVDIIQLAREHKLASAVFESDRLPLGTGSLSIQLGRLDQQSNQFVMNPDAPAKNVIITEENSSLRGIQEAINKSGAGVRASVINDGEGFRLVLSSLMPGSENTIRIKVNDDDGGDHDLAGLSAFSYLPEGTDIPPQGMGLDVAQEGLNLEEIISPQDSIIRIDGIEVSRSSNEIDDVVDGITLKLKPDAEGSTVRLNLTLSTGGIIESVNNFITRYNEMIDTVDTLTGYDPETKTAGPLSGDASIRGVISQIRRMLGSNYNEVNPSYGSLASVGIDTQHDGKLRLDNSKLQNAIENNFEQVVQLFAIAGSTSDPAVRYLQAGEDTKTDAYDLVIERMAKQGGYMTRALSVLPLVIEEGNNSFKIKVDGVESDAIELTARAYTDTESVARELQNQINAEQKFLDSDISVEVYARNDHLLIVSNRYGSASSVEITQADRGLRQELGLRPARGVNGEDIAGSFNGEAGTGSGRILTGKRAAEGLQVEILEGGAGERGQVYFSHGIAARIHDLTTNFLQPEGIIGIRTDGYGDRIADIAKEREKLARKLEVSEQRYLKQFTNLDATLGKMRSTGDYLSKQLSSLPGAINNKAK